MTAVAAVIPYKYQADILRHLGYGMYPADDDANQAIYKLALRDTLYILDHITVTNWAWVQPLVDQINAAYQEIWGARADLNNSQIGIITRNPNELAQRRAEYRALCQDLSDMTRIPFKRGSRNGIFV